MTVKTNVAPKLDMQHISYVLQAYSVNDEHSEAIDVNKSFSISPENIYKTLVLTGVKNPFLVAVTPGVVQVNSRRSPSQASPQVSHAYFAYLV
ncbi:hypothetical protein H8S90_15270 [Olivibacter sp. SDN3]|uniref:hypothetical protein n=1 Tax=Olivibacter sp. SDN3 TaxID=2764720 RepID=UPI0016518AC7|nr:hypothetical protein [Olivibacter sp. SDN3]QNL48161.1 hypothetical protein H8S90_15270 [Olivibacter sp. SDN3]